jgi:hypothetical protein
MGVVVGSCNLWKMHFLSFLPSFQRAMTHILSEEEIKNLFPPSEFDDAGAPFENSASNSQAQQEDGVNISSTSFASWPQPNNNEEFPQNTSQTNNGPLLQSNIPLLPPMKPKMESSEDYIKRLGTFKITNMPGEF